MTNIARLRGFVAAFSRLVERDLDETAILAEGRHLLAELIATDDWLPEAYATPDPQRYQQHLLYADPLDRLSIVSFVWGPGQATPVHDHRVWGLVGVLRGAEISERFEVDAGGKLRPTVTERLERGGVDAVSPAIGDVHRISNAYDDRPSISIHVYGGNIGTIRRATFKPDSFEAKEFVSSYSNAAVPNLWV